MLNLIFQMHLIISVSDFSDFLRDGVKVLTVRHCHPHTALAGQENLRAPSIEGEEETPDLLTELVVVHVGSESGPGLPVEDEALVVDGPGGSLALLQTQPSQSRNQLAATQ